MMQLPEGSDPEDAGARGLSGVDRLAAILSAGRAIVAALSAPAIQERMREAVLELLRAERCTWLSVGIDDAPASSDPCVCGMLSHALDTEQAVVLTGALREAFQLDDGAPRSALCVPVYTRWRVAGCLYATHGTIGRLFGEEEVRIGEYVAALGGAALENAEGLSRVKALTDSLEERIRERTEQLTEVNAKLGSSLVRLRETSDQLVDASRRAGMAEVATDVLHNVGNVLNSANVAVVVAADRLAKMRVDGVARAVALLHEHRADLCTYLTADPAGSKLLTYLEQLSQHLVTERGDVCTELQTAVNHMEHITQIISRQQAYAGSARVRGVIERVVLTTVLDDALRLCEDGLVRHRVVVNRDYTALPPVPVDRHGLLQVLVNLIRNAAQALAERGHPDPTLTLRLRPVEPEGVRIEVTDNGVGIPAEHLTRIFSHGFTTKQNGHGFGLHSSALTASLMGGSLTCTSDGPGCGATFALDLRVPIQESADTRM